MHKIDILGVQVTHTDMEGALRCALSLINGEKAATVYTPNSEICMLAYKDKDFCTLLNRGDLTVPDGIGLVYASRILKDPLPQRVAGFDLAGRILETVADGSKSVYFFGGKPGVAQKAISNLKEKYPSLAVAGFADGYFDAEKEKTIIEDICKTKPDILFVCLGAPKQEQWIDAHKEELPVHLIMGVGGSLDVWAGTVERAPEAYIKHGLEWLYRLKKQPSRFVRMLALPKFGITVLLRGKRVKKGKENE